MVNLAELNKRRWYFIKNLSKEEKKMFSVLAKMYKVGVKMKCQEIIGPYIVDFTIPPKMLIVEIDDHGHRYKEDYDFKREQYLADLGFDIFRVSNTDVKKCITAVKRVIQGYRTVPKWKLRYVYAISKGKEFLKHPGQLSLI